MKHTPALYCFLLWLLIWVVPGQSQDNPRQIESWLRQATIDSAYVDKLNDLSNFYTLSGERDPLPLAQKALGLADSLHYLRGKGIAHTNLAIIYDTRGNYHLALEHYLIGMKLLRKVQDEDHLSQLLQNLGFFYGNQGNYPKAIEVTKEAADLSLKNHGHHRAAYSWSNLGYYYTEAADYDSALYFTLRTYEVLKAQKDTAGLADVFFNLANISWKSDKNPGKALNYGLQALDFFLARPIEKETYLDCKSFVGYMYLKLGNYGLAEAYLQESLQEAKKHQYRFLMKNIYRWQAELYAAMKAWRLAYDCHARFFQLHDSIYSEHSANRVEQLKAEYELSSREAKIEMLRKLLQEDELAQQMIYRNGFMLLFVLFLGGAVYQYRSNRAKNTTNRILTDQKQQIEEQNAAILQQNKLLEEQKQTIFSQAHTLSQANHQISRQRQAIDEKTQDLSSSLHYASRIQNAMMPHPSELKSALPDSFIWLNPKEIVSGDFYWFAHLHNKVYLAAIDCTGHGVPGAFMSLIGEVYLNQTILQEEVQGAAQILDRLHEQIRRTLKQENGYNQDGMEVGLCVIDLETKELQFAGARHNLYMCQDGQMQKITGDRMYVGGAGSTGFSAHQLTIAAGTAFYLCTDGIRDQFGGDRDKKFGENRLLELLSDISTLPMAQQKDHLRQQMLNWMQGYEQTDDMMMIGWKL